MTTQYEAATQHLTTERKFSIGSDQPVTLLASQVRKLGPGSIYIGKGVAGIAAAAKFLPKASDAAQRAELTVRAPESDVERAKLAAAIIEYIDDHPMIAGSAYDPAHADEWAAHQALLARLREAT